MALILPTQDLKGRGAVSNRESRFETSATLPFDDGWGSLEAIQPKLKTTVHEDANRSLINRNQSPDIPFDQSINPYKGCEHGCIYCYARPTHSYLGLSAGLDFETQIFKKTRVKELLEKELRKPNYRVKTITIGANTDPYQPVERQHRVTRQILEVLAAFNHPLAIITKSAQILRDLDLLTSMARKDLVKVFVSITTLQGKLAALMEPRAAAPAKRLGVIKTLARNGIPTGVMAAPMIPALNDRELEQILAAAANAGAESAAYVLIRLPREVDGLFGEWLQTHFPAKAKHVMSLIRQTRGGQNYRAQFGQRMRGQGPYAQLLRQRFRVAKDRNQLNQESRTLNHQLFRDPLAQEQLSLFS